jgi:HEAT repeat protein
MTWLLLGLAFAGISEDLATASNRELDEAERMRAFNSLVLDWKTYRHELEAIALDQDHDARERWVVVRAMGQAHDPSTAEVLLKLLDDPMPAMRAGAASALGDLGDKAHAEAIAPLLRDDAMFVRASAADALGQIRDERSAEWLESALSDTSNYYRGSSLWVRVHYVAALGAIGNDSSIPALVACFDDADPLVVGAALTSLKSIVGFDFAEGRSQEEHIEAWRRWYANQ